MHYMDPRSTTPAYQGSDERLEEKHQGMARAAGAHRVNPTAGDVLGRLLLPPNNQTNQEITVAAPNPRPLAPTPNFPERSRQVYETKIGTNVTRGRSSGQIVDPVLAAEPEDHEFDDETTYDQAGR